MALFVNGEKVEQDLIDQEIERLRPEYEKVFGKDQEEKLSQWSRENVIERIVVRQLASNLTDDFTDETKQQYDKIIEQAGSEDKFFKDQGLDISEKQKILDDIEMQIKIKHLLDNAAAKAQAPTKKEINEFYEENKQRFTIPEMLRASHIVKHLSPNEENPELFEQMQAAAKELEEGVKFEDVAVKYSDCPTNGGDLGYYSRGKMVEDFEEITFETELGETTDIFRTQFGYHIAKVTDRKPATQCDMEQVQDYILKELTEMKKQKAVEDFIDKKVAQSTITEK